MIVQSFKSGKKTHRFNKGQRIWISMYFANHSRIYYRYRGKGRYVRGVVDNDFFGYTPELFEVSDSFARRVYKE